MSEGTMLIGGFVALCAAVAILVGGIGVTARYVSHHYDKAACHEFAIQTERTTRFVDYTFWSWDCITPTVNGKWISTDRLRDID